MTVGVQEPIAGRQALRLSLTVLVAELLALGMLRLGQPIGLSLGLPVAIAWIALQRRRLLLVARRLIHGIWRVTVVLGILWKRLKSWAFNRRTWRFRVRTLLFTVPLIALPCAYYSHRIHQVEREERLLDGKWRVLDWDGSPISIGGKPIVIELRPGTYNVDPRRQPKWIEFPVLGTSTVSKAIYVWDGARPCVCQDSGMTGNRPTTFDKSAGGRYVLERVEVGNDEK